MFISKKNVYNNLSTSYWFYTEVESKFLYFHRNIPFFLFIVYKWLTSYSVTLLCYLSKKGILRGSKHYTFNISFSLWSKMLLNCSIWARMNIQYTVGVPRGFIHSGMSRGNMIKLCFTLLLFIKFEDSDFIELNFLKTATVQLFKTITYIYYICLVYRKIVIFCVIYSMRVYQKTRWYIISKTLKLIV